MLVLAPLALLLSAVLAQHDTRGRRNRFQRDPIPQDAHHTDDQEVFPFRPADVRPGTSEDASSVIEFYDTTITDDVSTSSDDRRGSRHSHLGMLRKWWNWLWGAASQQSGKKDRKDRKGRRHGKPGADRSPHHPSRQPPTTVTVTKTVFTTVTVTRDKLPAAVGFGPAAQAAAAGGEDAVRQQNARRQAAFNEWFDQTAVNSAFTGPKTDQSDD